MGGGRCTLRVDAAFKRAGENRLLEVGPADVWQQYFDKITWNQNARMVEVDMLEAGLPAELRKTIALWRTGADLRTFLSKATFYRHRQVLLRELGVDIASPPPATADKTGALADTPAGLDPKGWDPEPLEGYAWTPDGTGTLV